jgi:formylglycine-generating enzyme required for sulfatase activity
MTFQIFGCHNHGTTPNPGAMQMERTMSSEQDKPISADSAGSPSTDDERPAASLRASGSGASHTISTEGGVYAEGDVAQRGAFVRDSTVGGHIIGVVEGNLTIQAPEDAFDVVGLPNPYLGLRSFTYADHERYAGRRQIIELAVQKLAGPGVKRTLLFITGASGSGKSSFAQAGLMPALDQHYAQRHIAVRRALFRPSSQPLVALGDALSQLSLPVQEFDLQRTPSDFSQVLGRHTSPEQVNLLVIDQFEELFTQSEPAGRDALFAILEHLPTLDIVRTQIIATIRSDYLPELFEHPALYDLAKQGIDLRAMSVGELRDAIQRPLQQAYPGAGKRFEPALLEKLARDAAGDAAYLPLLQVTLEDLWARGSLMLSAYGTLTDAIRQRAEVVYTYTDHANLRSMLRTAPDQATILQIFLDLIEVSLDDEARRDVRRRRPYAELTQGRDERARLVDDLVDARLLSKSLEIHGTTQVDVIDVIHETLIGNWERLRQTITSRRTALRQRARFEHALREWLANDRAATYLLDGVRLAEALEIERQGDIVLQGKDAREFLGQSRDKHAAEAERQRAQAQALAETQVRAARRLRWLVAVLAVLAAALPIFRVYQRTLALSTGSELVRLGGQIMIGSDEKGVAFPDDGPPWPMEVPPFWIERFEVANWQYYRCVLARVCEGLLDPLYKSPERWSKPIVDVTAYQAATYCGWLGRHLPTEVEWELAARGIEGRPWPWRAGPPDGDHLNIRFESDGSLSAVDSYPLGQTPEGIFNLAGNAMEWTASRYRRYSDPAYDPKFVWNGELIAQQLVVRGGGITSPERSARPTARAGLVPDSARRDLGFRCAQSAQ